MRVGSFGSSRRTSWCVRAFHLRRVENHSARQVPAGARWTCSDSNTPALSCQAREERLHQTTSVTFAELWLPPNAVELTKTSKLNPECVWVLHDGQCCGQPRVPSSLTAVRAQDESCAGSSVDPTRLHAKTSQYPSSPRSSALRWTKCS
jgi:hypothetical protein